MSFLFFYFYFFGGFLVVGYAVRTLTNKEGLTEKGGYLGTAVGALYGLIYATGLIKVISGKYEEHKTVINGLQADLDCLAPKIREKARKVDDMAETMNGLKM